MRDHDNRTRVISQKFLEPLERFKIEMVGRLIEQEKIGLHYQKPRQVRTHDPATAHGLRWPIEIAFAKSESGEYSLRLRFKLPAAVLVENVQRAMIGSVV